MSKASTTAMRPIADHIVVRRFESEDKSPGGIVLPDAAKERPMRGRVVAVGSGQLLRDGSRSDMEVAEGDTVMFNKHGGTEITIDDDEFVVLREQDVLMVLGE